MSMIKSVRIFNTPRELDSVWIIYTKLSFRFCFNVTAHFLHRHHCYIHDLVQTREWKCISNTEQTYHSYQKCFGAQQFSGGQQWTVSIQKTLIQIHSIWQPNFLLRSGPMVVTPFIEMMYIVILLLRETKDDIWLVPRLNLRNRRTTVWT